MNYAISIPELAVTNCNASLKFYCDVLGFSVVYERKDEGFAFLERDGSAVAGIGVRFEPEYTSITQDLRNLLLNNHLVYLS